MVPIAHVFSHKRTELRRLNVATTRLCCAEAPGSKICGASEQFGIAQLPNSSGLEQRSSKGALHE